METIEISVPVPTKPEQNYFYSNNSNLFDCGNAHAALYLSSK